MNRNHIYRTYWIVAVSGLFIIGVASVFILARSNWPGYGEVIATAELEALGGYVDQMEIWHHDLPGWVHYTSEAGRKIDEFVPQCISIHSRSWLPAKLADQVGIRHPKHVLRGTVHGTASLRHLGNLKFVRYVDFEDSDTDDETMKALGRMPDLIGINLSKTRVSDRGITHLGSLRHLEDLNLSGTLIGDDALLTLSHIPSLKYLALDGTRITDAGFAHLAQLPHLENLSFRNTAITDTGFMTLTSGKYDSLVIFPLCTRVTAQAVEALRKARPNFEIDFVQDFDCPPLPKF